MTIFFDQRWDDATGIGRFCREVKQRLPELIDMPLTGNPAAPADVLRMTWFMLRQPDSLAISPGYNAPFFSLNRYVLTVHDLNHLDLPDNSDWRKRLYYRLILRRACRKAAKVLTVSEFSRRRIIDWAGTSEDQVICVGNGVSEIFLQGEQNDVSRPADDGFLFCVGNRKKHKNEKMAIAALAALQEYPRLQLIFSGSPSDELLREAVRLNVAPRIQFTGKLSEEQLRDYYCRAAVLVFPSRYEGFGLPAVEAMAVGCPVIASNTTALGEIVGGAGALILPDQPWTLVSSLKVILNSPARRKELQSLGHDRARKYSWDNVAGRIKKELSVIN
ncbi:glycosyltransferase family 4 protein [Solimonas marina]|uniref:Glycosyltransferase family 4 protein n=1 Tax=Solimonas marina TaxID=2714601 RepID=A0A970B8Z3_9GAMM|nr:glycosyltransferase family 1 protein [Solimonas marina]NKF21891.1 glycosyltransferase family 4 protein [Solimonas marina]